MSLTSGARSGDPAFLWFLKHGILTWAGVYDTLLPAPTLVPWCSGLTCGPVKAEIAGSNPVGAAKINTKNQPKRLVFCYFIPVSVTIDWFVSLLRFAGSIKS
jgi:hypothetical protein